jgi:predicted transglutaminase-like cysteine proteinase
MGALTGSRCLARLLAFGILAVGSAATASGTFAAHGKSTAILGGISRLDQISARQQNTSIAARQSEIEAPAIPEPAAQPDFTRFRSQPDFTTSSRLVPSDRPDIFGSVALAVSHTPLDAQWRRASENHFNEQGPWTTLIASLRTLPAADQLKLVNKWVNARIQFTEDRTEYGKSDHWANGADTIRRGRGDCEDYALAKMQLLRAIGFPANDIYISIVKDLVRRADHAVLIVRSEGHFLMLDNNTDRLVDAYASQDYRPVFTYGATQSWVHGYSRERYADRTNGRGGVMIAAR